MTIRKTSRRSPNRNNNELGDNDRLIQEAEKLLKKARRNVGIAWRRIEEMRLIMSKTL